MLTTQHHQQHQILSTSKERGQLTPNTQSHSQRKKYPKGEGYINEQYQHYLKFKQQLLQTLVSADPLALLQSDIFQKYQTCILEAHIHDSVLSPQIPKISPFQGDISSFDTKLNSYEVSDVVKVTQIQRRSRSCERLSLQRRTIQMLQTQRNVQFGLFSNAVRQLSHISTSSYQDGCSQPQEGYLTQLPQNHSVPSQTITKVQQIRMDELQHQNQQLSNQLQDCLAKSQQQKIINRQVYNDRKDQELQFLLREKQLQKKLVQARSETEELRRLLQLSPQKVRPSVIVSEQNKFNEENRMTNLRQRVAVEGRVRWALSKAWGAELSSECQ